MFKNIPDMKIVRVWFDDENIFLQTDIGHIIGNPLNWFARLKNATPEERNNFETGPIGESIHWEEIDEDISLESLFDFKRELHYANI